MLNSLQQTYEVLKYELFAEDIINEIYVAKVTLHIRW
jgi:hypothetical protein